MIIRVSPVLRFYCNQQESNRNFKLNATQTIFEKFRFGLDIQTYLWYVVVLEKGLIFMSTRKLLTNGNAFKRTDNRWGGVVWYMDESGERKRKSFSSTTKAEVNKKMTEYIAAFNDSIIESQETKKRLRDSMQNWLEVFKFPSVERTTYGRYECTAKNQIYPYIGDKVVGDIKSADIKNCSMTK